MSDGPVSDREYFRFVKSIDSRLARIDKNQAESVAYSMQNEQRITEVEFTARSQSNDISKITETQTTNAPIIASYAAVRKYVIAVTITLTGLALTSLYTTLTKPGQAEVEQPNKVERVANNENSN